MTAFGALCASNTPGGSSGFPPVFPLVSDIWQDAKNKDPVVSPP